MNARTMLVVLLVVFSVLAGLVIGEQFNVRPLAAVNQLSAGASFGSDSKESAFVRFLPSCLGQGPIHSCAKPQLSDPVSIFGHIEPVAGFDERSRFVGAARGVGRIDFLVSTERGKVMDTCSAFLISDHHVMT